MYVTGITLSLNLGSKMVGSHVVMRMMMMMMIVN